MSTAATGTSVLQATLEYRKLGLWCVPIKAGTKSPALENWPHLRLDSEEALRRYFSQSCGVGALLGIGPKILADLDLDCPEALRVAQEVNLHSKTDRVFGHRSKPGSHLFFEVDREFRTVRYEDPTDKTTLLEIRGTGGQTVCPPSIHPSGEPIRWEKCGQFTRTTIADLQRLASKVAAVALLAKNWPGAGARHVPSLALAGMLAVSGWSEDYVIQFLSQLATVVGDTKLQDRLTEVRSTCKKVLSGDARVTQRRELEGCIGEKVVAKLREWLGLPNRTAATATTTQSARGDLLSFPFNDYGNGQRLLALRGDDILWCPPMNAFLIWNGGCWRRDDTDQVGVWMQEALLQFAHQALQAGNWQAAKFAGACLNKSRTINAQHFVRLVRPILPGQLDQDFELMNFQNGTLNMRTLEFREHRREDRITKMVNYDFDPAPSCTETLKFMARCVTPEIVPFLLRALAYSLTGKTSEKMTFWAWGPTNSGKTTLLNLIRMLFKDYSALLEIETLVQKDADNNSREDLCRLRGARFCMTSETGQGQRLNEARLKRITQGQGEISAARKYEHIIEFPETHVLWFDANYKLVVRGTDDSVWGRFAVIPFGPSVPTSERDPLLPEKLRAEAEGFIALLMTEAAAWYRSGLGQIPDQVKAAGAQWRKEMDRVGAFIETCCLTEAHLTVMARPLYEAYKKWAEAAGERHIPEKDFKARMVELKFEIRDTNKGNQYLGIGLREGSLL